MSYFFGSWIDGAHAALAERRDDLVAVVEDPTQALIASGSSGAPTPRCVSCDPLTPDAPSKRVSHTISGLLVRVTSVIVILALPLVAAAQPSSKGRADALVAEAEAAAAAGDFPGAARKYRAAHAIDPRPELLCNVGVAYHKAKDLPRAQLLLGQCLGRGASLEATFVEAVRAAQAQTEQLLRDGPFGTVDVVVVPEGTAFTVSTFGADETIVGSRLLWLPFGTHELTFRAAGHVDQIEEVVIDAKNEIKLRVTLEPRAVPKPRSRGPAIAATVATGVLGAAAVGSYLIARDKASQAGSTEISLSEYDSLTSSARTWQKVSWGFAGAAAVGAVVSGYLWYRARNAPTVRVEAAPTAGGAAVWLTGEL